MEDAALRRHRELARVPLDDLPHADHPEAVVAVRLAGGAREAVFKHQLPLVPVAHVDGYHAPVLFDGDGDDLLVALEMLDRAHGVVDGVAEQAVHVRVLHEEEGDGVGHAGEADALRAAAQALFGEDDVQRLVARLEGRVVDGDGVGDLGEDLAVQNILPDRADLVLEVVAFEVDEADGLLREDVLLLLLAAEALFHVEVVLEVAHAQQLELDVHEQAGTEYVVHRQHDERVAVVRVVTGVRHDGAEHDVEQTDEDDDGQQGQVLQVDGHVLPHPPAEDQVDREIGEEVAPQKCRKGLGVLQKGQRAARNVDGRGRVEVEEQADDVVQLEGDVLHAVAGERAEEDALPALFKAELHQRDRDGEHREEHERVVQRAVADDGDEKADPQTEEHHQPQAQQKIGLALEFEAEQRLGAQQFGHKDGAVPKELGRGIIPHQKDGRHLSTPPPKYRVSACMNCLRLDWLICSRSPVVSSSSKPFTPET